MFFTILDLILLLVIFIFVAYGFIMGFIESIGALVGLVVGVWVGGILYKDVGEWISSFIIVKNFSYVIAFVVLFAVTSKLVSFGFHILNKIYKIFSIIPFLKSTNRIIGAAFGLCEAVLVLGVVLVFVSQFPFSPWLTRQMAQSQLALWLMAVAKVLTPILPKIFSVLPLSR